MEKYKLRDFARWARKEGIKDSELTHTLREMAGGLLGNRLGADLYKKRMALPGRGKRGGARTIILFKSGELALFIYGYSKNELGSLSQNEEKGLRIFAKGFLQLSRVERAEKIRTGALELLGD